jgi:hypothetical protein
VRPGELRTRLPLWLPAAVVLAIAAAGMIRVLAEHWREGAALLGGSLLVAAALRVLLPDDRAGLLAIRSRVIDVLCYVLLAVGTIVLALTITRGGITFT